jgi:cell division initiation protein
MRISPQDIRQQQFTVKTFRGFDPQEVDAFLEDVADDYEALLKECQLLKEQLAVQEVRQRGVSELEKALQDTLLTSQRLADEMKSAARREAEEMRTAATHESELIVREAELRGEKAVEAARADEARIRTDIQALKRTRRQFVEDLSATLERYRRYLAGEATPEEGDGG